MKEKFYVITGLNEGREIKPYIVYGSETLEYALTCHGDCSRNYEAFNNECQANKKIEELKK